MLLKQLQGLTLDSSVPGSWGDPHVASSSGAPSGFGRHLLAPNLHQGAHTSPCAISTHLPAWRPCPVFPSQTCNGSCHHHRLCIYHLFSWTPPPCHSRQAKVKKRVLQEKAPLNSPAHQPPGWQPLAADPRHTSLGKCRCNVDPPVCGEWVEGCG